MSGKENRPPRHSDELEWTQFRRETLGILAEEPEPQASKFFRRVKENPLVPVGALVTVGALTYGLAAMRKGEIKMSQKMMRLRVAAQGFTVIAILGGLLASSFTGKGDKTSV